MIRNDLNLIRVLEENGVVVMPTDTLYGIVGRAQEASVVNRIYDLKKRTSLKPCIILIGDISELEKFSITLNREQRKIIEKYWSFNFTQDKTEPVSIVLDCPNDSFAYLHRGTRTLAFRVPTFKPFREFLLNVGPLLAPSANPEGLPPAKDIFEAKDYFGDKVDLYVDGGIITGKASRLVKLYRDGSEAILRI
ncbi:MAG: L-threonylcarbamoyladenylate synthase [Candidatus Paceibacterota bacterium]|jgi:L-threonylcarbamoyladenylate synthase